jgi:inosine-uridine nucleoside N-ribohydrolase
MVLLTDIGKDPDDAVALVYAIITGIPITDIVVTTKEAAESCHLVYNILENLSERYPAARNIKVYSGSTSPIKKKAKPFHTNIYKGDFCETGPVPDKFEPLKIEQPQDCVAIGPLTDLLSLMEKDRVKKVMFMGQAKKDHETLLPDFAAYNLRCDPFASEGVFQFQDRIPFAFVGKNLAYKVPFTTEDIESLDQLSNPIGPFLADHARQSFEEFKTRMPDVWKSKYEGTNNMSYCYDPLTMLAMRNPGLFTFEKFGKHRIGVDVEADQAKAKLLDTIREGLS